MKKLTVLLVILLLVAGCAGTKPKPPVTEGKNTKDVDEAHITVSVKDITFGVSNRPKFFKKDQIPADEGFVVVGLGIVFKNNNKEISYPIDPKFITLTTDDGQNYKYNEAKTNAVTGKGALKATELMPDWRLSGLILFDIKENAKIKSVSYSDNNGHTVKIDLLKGPTGV
ncbi:MAG: DUF4352 domain-containing protein [Clostridia bacterium]|nr:DUF4352 domain-containing protein [Clostridia bacterium]